MSNPEPPTVRGSSNSARIPASLTSRHNPRKGEPAVTKSTWNPAAIRGSRYTNLRIPCKALISAGPARVMRNQHTNPIDPSYLSARTPHLFKESTSAMSSALNRPSLSRQFAVFPPYPRPYGWIATVVATSANKNRCRQ
jgi:hypothetical protein